MTKIVYIAIVFLFMKQYVVAQVFVIKVNKDSVLIGEPIELTLSVKSKPNDTIIWPIFSKGDSLPDGFEVLEVLPKQQSNNQTGVEMQQLVITSFYPGKYKLKPFVIQHNDKVITSNIVPLTVGLVSGVDTLQPFLPLKPLKEPTITFGDRMGQLWTWVKNNWYIPLAILVALVVFIWLLVRFRRKKSAPIVETALPAPKIIPHEKAFKDFNTLKELDLLNKQEYKQHYVILSEILNQYLANRYRVSTQDKTSDEVLTLVKNHVNNPEQFESLKAIFSTSDLVKFAKQIPSSEVNDKLFNQSVQFVKDTAS